MLNLREPMKEMGERGDMKKEQVLRLSEIAKRPVNARGGTGDRVAGLRTGAFVLYYMKALTSVNALDVIYSIY